MIAENKALKIESSQENGVITSILHKETNWDLIAQPALASIWKLVVPVDGHRNNKIYAQDQILSSAEEISQDSIRLVWSGLKGNHSVKLDIEVEVLVSLHADEVHFQMHVANKSPYIVEEAWLPCIGGMRQPAGQQSFTSASVDMCGGFHTTPMGDGFPQTCGYWGTDYPTFIKTYGSEVAQFPFVLLTNNETGIYIGMHSMEQDIVSFVHELRPGYTDSKHCRIPKSDTLGGHLAGYVISAALLPFIQPNTRKELPTTILRPFRGDWHEGVATYKKWRETWHSQRKPLGWVKEIGCWMTLHINSPEGCCRYRYSELVEVARDAKQYGVQLLQLIGWAKDGQDGAEPFQDTDDRLGTREELKEAIRQIEALGIRVLLMCKFKWMDASVKSSELITHTAKDMYGNPAQFPGYAYQTLTQQLFGASRRSGATLCQSSSDYRKFALKEFAKIVDLEPSGILYDELMNDRLLCFDPHHDHCYGDSNLKGEMQMADDFYRYVTERKLDFLFAGESPTDALSQYYPVTYVRTEDGRWADQTHRPVLRYINNAIKVATCLTGFDDREMVNQCMVFGSIINYEPFRAAYRTCQTPRGMVFKHLGFAKSSRSLSGKVSSFTHKVQRSKPRNRILNSSILFSNTMEKRRWQSQTSQRSKSYRRWLRRRRNSPVSCYTSLNLRMKGRVTDESLLRQEVFSFWSKNKHKENSLWNIRS
jgi:hypothetical protein